MWEKRAGLPDPSKAAGRQRTFIAKEPSFLLIRLDSRGQLIVKAQERRKLFPGHTLNLTSSCGAENLSEHD